MGTWGTGPMENDSALDWIHSFINDKIDTNYLISEAKNALSIGDNEETTRAIAFVVGFINSTNTIPEKNETEFNKITKLLREELENMINPDSDYLDLWDEDDEDLPELINQINKEINLLK